MKKFLAAIFFILVLILGFIFYNKFYEFGNKEFTKERIIYEVEEILNNRISNVYVLFNESNKEINDMSNENKLLLASLYLKDNVSSKGIENYKSTKILKELRKSFGNDFNVEFKDIYNVNDSSKLVYKYNYKTKRYLKESNILGMDLILPLRMELTEYKSENDEYILSYKQMFYNEFSENNVLNIVNIKGEKVFDVKLSEDGNINITDKDFDKYKDKLITVDYIFKIEDNRLFLKGYELK